MNPRDDASTTTPEVVPCIYGLLRVSYAGGNLTSFGKKPFLTWGFL
jgi:hypothetical protein